MTEDSLEGTIAGQTFRLSGRESIYLVITAACLVVVGYMLWASSREMLDQTEKQTRVLTLQHADATAKWTAEHEALRQSMDGMTEAIQEQNYIITLPNEKRERLNLAMPPSLRRKVEQ
jgi:hypothetical protein